MTDSMEKIAEEYNHNPYNRAIRIRRIEKALGLDLLSPEEYEQIASELKRETEGNGWYAPKQQFPTTPDTFLKGIAQEYKLIIPNWRLLYAPLSHLLDRFTVVPKRSSQRKRADNSRKQPYHVENKTDTLTSTHGEDDTSGQGDIANTMRARRCMPN